MQKVEGSWQPRNSATTVSRWSFHFLVGKPIPEASTTQTLAPLCVPKQPPEDRPPHPIPIHRPHSGSESFQKQGFDPTIPPGGPATAPMALGVKP